MNPFTPLFLLLGGSLASLLVDRLLEKIGAIRWRGCLAACILAIALLLFSWEAYHGVQVAEFIVVGPKSPLTASLKLDYLGLYFSIMFCGLGLAVCVYSLNYFKSKSEIEIIDRYYLLLLALVAGMVGVILANDFFTLYVFWELMALSSYSLVAFRKWSWEAVEAGFKYLVMGVTGSIAILFGMSLLYGFAGTLNLTKLASILESAEGGMLLHIALLMLIAGFGIKAAIVPLHTWLPDAYTAAPSPVSAIIAGASTGLGALVICKLLFFLFPHLSTSWTMFFAAFSVLNMLIGNVAGLLQDDVKRMLAYSSIAHIGYIFIGVAAGTQLGLTGALLHIFNHGILKALAFLCIGAIIYRLNARSLDDITGVGRKMPITTSAFILAILGLIGMPPLNGFVSKLILFMSSLEAGMLWLGILLVIFSAVSTGYYLRILKVLIAPPNEKVANVKEAPLLMLAPMLVLAFLVILFGIWPDPILAFIESSSSMLCGGGRIC